MPDAGRTPADDRLTRKGCETMDDEREQTELELAEMELELCQNECTDLAKRANSAEAALEAVPWQALLNISHALAASDVAHDPDEAALLQFLNRYAPWAQPSGESER